MIRTEKPADMAAVRRVNEKAFDTPAEAGLVERLWEQADPIVSLVAEEDGEIAGHIMFSPVEIEGCDSLVMGLAPMAVEPSRQRQGIGSALVREGLARCDQIGTVAVVVLGHSDYYPRFGFVPASRFGIGSEYDVPDEVFMATELLEGSLGGISGTARYHPAFASL